MQHGKKVSVLGLGKTGFASALFLKAQGFEVFASDQSEGEAVKERAQILDRKGVAAETGRHSSERILDSDWILISPGVSPQTPLYRQIKARNIPITSEIEAASWYSPSSSIIGVTGTSGKTTVTTLLARLFQKTGKSVLCCGNIGTPWIGEIPKMNKNDVVVLELSSFQLQHCQTFRPQTGILLNLSPNHQDWHQDMTEYVEAKLCLFQNQKAGDFAVLRRSDQKHFFPEHSFQAKTVYFDEPGINPNYAVIRHIGDLFNIPRSVVDEVWNNFEGVEHRLEKFLMHSDVAYINDSKCTTPASLAWALEKFPDSKVILIAGGHPKSDDFDMVSELIKRKVKTAILIGEARPLLRRAWDGLCPSWETNDFHAAVQKACQSAAPGDTVLLSPACASFDMFRNYEERGNLFKQTVHEILAAKNSALLSDV
ncbi:MAG: UDP-N-acetylmuramoyl-L-alanine--D-glutamate ligase [Candidatus Omnitrophica bacterium]|nr:UDP-N-acetylmuramoyl-L-alanine--D-glutamate ligase [Candidatus Omnitrophota bacterium]